MAMLVAARPELVDIYLAGVKVSELLREVVCGDVNVPGAKVHIPNNRFTSVISRIHGIDINDWRWGHDFISFLAMRCSPEFLVEWVKACPEDFEKIIAPYRISNHNFCLILARLNRLGCLSEAHRQTYLANAIAEVLESGEPTFLSDDVRDLMTPEEYESVIKRIKDELIPDLESKIDYLAANYSDPDEEPADYFSDLRSNLTNLQDVVEDDEIIKELGHADWLIDNAVDRLEDENKEREEEKKRKKQEEEEAEAFENEALQALVEEHEHEKANRSRQIVKPDMPSKNLFQKPSARRDIFDDVDQ